MQFNLIKRKRYRDKKKNKNWKWGEKIGLAGMMLL